MSAKTSTRTGYAKRSSLTFKLFQFERELEELFYRLTMDGERPSKRPNLPSTLIRPAPTLENALRGKILIEWAVTSEGRPQHICVRLARTMQS
jgi:hypothetical protein